MRERSAPSGPANSRRCASPSRLMCRPLASASFNPRFCSRPSSACFGSCLRTSAWFWHHHRLPIPGYIVWCALLYAFATSFLSWRVGKQLILLNADRPSRVTGASSSNSAKYRPPGVSTGHGSALKYPSSGSADLTLPSSSIPQKISILLQLPFYSIAVCRLRTPKLAFVSGKRLEHLFPAVTPSKKQPVRPQIELWPDTSSRSHFAKGAARMVICLYSARCHAQPPTCLPPSMFWRDQMNANRSLTGLLCRRHAIVP
jgi:hypothetical protein